MSTLPQEAAEGQAPIPRLLDVHDIARILRCHTTKAYPLMREIGYVRRGGRLFVRPETLEAWLRDQEIRPESER